MTRGHAPAAPTRGLTSTGAAALTTNYMTMAPPGLVSLEELGAGEEARGMLRIDASGREMELGAHGGAMGRRTTDARGRGDEGARRLHPTGCGGGGSSIRPGAVAAAAADRAWLRELSGSCAVAEATGMRRRHNRPTAAAEAWGKWRGGGSHGGAAAPAADRSRGGGIWCRAPFFRLRV